MEFTYSLIDRIFRLSIGERGDFSGAMYDGDFSLTLEEAQAKKHRFISDMLGVKSGTRVLDMGCGWGPLLEYFRTLGAEAKGLTLSTAQAASCIGAGLDVEIADCRTITKKQVGQFDAVTSLGAFEHFCSAEDYLQGRQDAIYESFFHTVADLLPSGGRFFLQTMVFGRNMIDYRDIDIHATRGSVRYSVAVMQRQFPGSWLPFGREQIERNAAPYFRTVAASSGRLDYIETIRQWGLRYRRFSAKKYGFYLTLLPRYLADRKLRERLSRDQVRANVFCFEEEVLDHLRLVFEKR